MASLADRYQRRIDRSASGSFKTKVKYDEGGSRVGGGTRVTQSTVSAIRGDENDRVVIYENNARIISAAIGNAIVAALEEMGLVAEAAAKRLCPVDTGRLRNSITHALYGDDTVVIGTNVEYAIYVHEGTSRSKGVPFLYDAVINNKGRFSSILRKHMQK